MKKNLQKFISVLLLLAAGVVGLQAQEPPKTQSDAMSDETIKQANNPMASIKTLNVHNYYIPSIHGAPSGTTMNQTMLRYAQPMGRFIVRATMPLEVASGPGVLPTSGLGDFNMFVIYDLFESKGNQYGIGPCIVAPSGTNGMGQGKWQVGLSALAFLASRAEIQMGGLLQWQMSVGGWGYTDVNQLTAQAFFLWQLGKGTYLRSTGIWMFDLEGGGYNVPIGLGMGKVVKVGKTVFNIFAEPQYSVWAHGIQPKFQVFVGFNTQF